MARRSIREMVRGLKKQIELEEVEYTRLEQERVTLLQAHDAKIIAQSTKIEALRGVLETMDPKAKTT